MEQKKQPVPEYFFSAGEWDRLGCGPLPPERDKDRQDISEKSVQHKDDAWPWLRLMWP